MKVLVIGGGGREHALAWKLAQSPRVSEVLVAPGNAGTATEPRCRNVPVAAEDIPGLLALAKAESVGLTIVGPEGPLVAGVVDAFLQAGLPCFGPRQAAAQLEGSKQYTKAFLARHTVPYRCISAVGSISDEIIGAAKAEKAHMIVMGTHGYGLVGRFFMGSIAQRVVADCDVPVLLVK